MTPDLLLEHYLGVIRRRRAIVLVAFVVMVGGSVLASSLQTPIYRGTAKVLLQPRSSDSLFDSSAAVQRLDPERALQTEIQVLKSEPVRDLVRTRIGSVPPVSASPILETDVIEVRGDSAVPDRAAAIANAYASAYVDFRRKQTVDDLLAAGQEVQSKVADLQEEIDALEGEIAAAPTSRQTTVRQVVQERKDTLVQQQGLFKQRLDQLQVDAALKSGGAQLVGRAATPTSPVTPRPVRNGILGVLSGLMLGIGLALVREYFDNSIKSKEDLERAVPAISVVGLIPRVSDWKTRGEARIVSFANPRSSAAEAYRTLRTSIHFLALDRPVRTLQVTSPSADEGKSTTVANLGVAFARAGQRVVIVGCDLRRPRIHEFFGLPNSVGLTSVLLGRLPLMAALQAVPQSGLSILPAGPVPPNPAEVLSSARVEEVLSEIDADIVLIDSPPILPVTDALVLAPRVDATLVVALVESTARKEIARAIEMLRQVDAPVAGAVLNGVSEEGSYGYGYRYYGDPHTNGSERARDHSGETVLALPLASNGAQSDAGPASDWSDAWRRLGQPGA